MKTLLMLATLALLASVGHAFTVAGGLKYIRGRADFERGTAAYRFAGEADGAAVTSLLFAVRQNVSSLERDLAAVSNPTSPSYGRHLSFQDMARYANPNGTAAVHAFLEESDVESVTTTPHGEYVKVSMTVGQASKLLRTRFYNFTRRGDNATFIVRCPGYFLPAGVASQVTTIGYTTSFPSAATADIRGLRVQASSTPNGYATPAVIAAYYGIKNQSVATTQSTNAVFESNKQSYSPADLKSYDQQFGVPQQHISKVIGFNSPSSCSDPNNCDEASLDVQVITSIAQDTNTVFWAVPGTETFLEFANAVASDPNPPKVISVSYTSVEAELDQGSMTSFDTEAAKLGTRGITIFVAAGDDGVAGENARGNPSACGFNPVFPASPHVTSVGATQGPEAGKPEVACSSATGGIITTGGGFSNVFTTPSYQAAAVSQYLSNAPDLPPTSMFNTQGRGYPDIGAMGNHYISIIGGQELVGSGTSASTPLVAAMVTLINANRILDGKSTLGFLNPALYQLRADAFHDITVGKNNCAAGTNGDETCCQYGFSASSGWDPLTGVGTPVFPVFSAALEALP